MVSLLIDLSNNNISLYKDIPRITDEYIGLSSKLLKFIFRTKTNLYVLSSKPLVNSPYTGVYEISRRIEMGCTIYAIQIIGVRYECSVRDCKFPCKACSGRIVTVLNTEYPTCVGFGGGRFFNSGKPGFFINIFTESQLCMLKNEYKVSIKYI